MIHPGHDALGKAVTLQCGGPGDPQQSGADGRGLASARPLRPPPSHQLIRPCRAKSGARGVDASPTSPAGSRTWRERVSPPLPRTAWSPCCDPRDIQSSHGHEVSGAAVTRTTGRGAASLASLLPWTHPRRGDPHRHRHAPKRARSPTRHLLPRTCPSRTPLHGAHWRGQEGESWTVVRDAAPLEMYLNFYKIIGVSLRTTVLECGLGCRVVNNNNFVVGFIDEVIKAIDLCHNSLIITRRRKYTM